MSETEAMKRQMAEFASALGAMQQIVGELPSAADAERAMAIDRRLSKIAQMVFAGVAMVALILAAVGWIAWQGKNRADQSEKATECLIEQFTEHRHAQRSAHQAFASKLDAPYTIEPGDLPPPIPHGLEVACRPFLEGS